MLKKKQKTKIPRLLLLKTCALRWDRKPGKATLKTLSFAQT